MPDGSDGSRCASRSIAQRNAARVLPDPVGATTRACRPCAIADHAPACAGGGRAEGAGEPLAGRGAELVEHIGHGQGILPRLADSAARVRRQEVDEEGRDVGELGLGDTVAEHRVLPLGQRGVRLEPRLRPCDGSGGDDGIDRAPAPEHRRPKPCRELRIGRAADVGDEAGQHRRRARTARAPTGAAAAPPRRPGRSRAGGSAAAGSRAADPASRAPRGPTGARSLSPSGVGSGLDPCPAALPGHRARAARRSGRAPRAAPRGAADRARRRPVRAAGGGGNPPPGNRPRGPRRRRSA